MTFEVFSKPPIGRPPDSGWADRVEVSIQKSGSILLTRAAYRALGHPALVEFLYDRNARVIGLRPTGEVPHAYPVRATRGSGYMVSGRAFTQHYGIDTEATRRWPASIERNILCVDLNAESEPTATDTR